MTRAALHDHMMPLDDDFDPVRDLPPFLDRRRPILRPHGGFKVVYADPAWSFKLHSENGEGKSAQSHYDCMPLDQIFGLSEELKFNQILAPDCVLLLWATFPMLPQALRTMNAWGFEYKTGGPWVKTTTTGKMAFGTGYIFRSASELFLLGTRGRPKALNRNTRNAIWQEAVEGEFDVANFAPRREHSRKPGCMYLMIESLFQGPYLELFARTIRHNWTSWGNQTDRFDGEH